MTVTETGEWSTNSITEFGAMTLGTVSEFGAKILGSLNLTNLIYQAMARDAYSAIVDTTYTAETIGDE